MEEAYRLPNLGDPLSEESTGNSEGPDGDAIPLMPTATLNSPQSKTEPMSPPPRPSAGRTRPLSMSARTNRLSLSFPVQLPEPSGSAKQSPVPSSPEVFPGLSPRLSSTPTLATLDSGGFLVAIAAQERRVLELKEELTRAEAELGKIKRQWAVHEAKKKRAEIKNIEKLRPLQTPQDADSSSAAEDDQGALKKSIELDRRKAILEGVNRESRRKVITGSHTRTLSLLSPDRSSCNQSPVLIPPAFGTSNRSSEENELNSPNLPPFDRAESDAKVEERSNSDARYSYQGGPTGGVKQLAEDLRAGLWTFMEDLRQATVGDEVVQRPSIETSNRQLSKTNSKRSLKDLTPEQITHRKAAREKHALTESSASGVSTPSRSKIDPLSRPSPDTPAAKQLLLDVDPLTGGDEDWSNWESSDLKKDQANWNSSAVVSQTEHSQSQTISPFNISRNPFEYIASVSSSPSPKLEDSPWPALSNFAPGNLKRTATALMKEWERSLTPPPEPRKNHLSFSSSSKQPIDEHEARVSLSNLP